MGWEKAIVSGIALGDPLGPLEETGPRDQPDPQAGRAIVLVKLLRRFLPPAGRASAMSMTTNS